MDKFHWNGDVPIILKISPINDDDDDDETTLLWHTWLCDHLLHYHSAANIVFLCNVI